MNTDKRKSIPVEKRSSRIPNEVVGIEWVRKKCGDISSAEEFTERERLLIKDYLDSKKRVLKRTGTGQKTLGEARMLLKKKGFF